MAIWAAALPQRTSATLQNTIPAAPRRYMPGAPEIYFHKAIDNSRLVRTADPARTREMRMFTATVVIFFLMALVYLGQHCSSIQYGYRIEDLRSKRDQMADEMGFALPAVGQVQRLDETGALDTGAPVMARADNISVVSVPN